MTKHTPATPLPWTAYLPEDSNGYWYVAEGNIVVYNSEIAAQEAAYIAHAANAYPRLVEVLARMERQISEICPQASTLSYARALLRELGEND